MDRLANIKNEALNIGACCKIDDVDNYTHLAELFFSAQGREFCQRNNFPTLEQFKQVKEEILPYNIFIDKGDIEISNTHKIALIGSTHAKIKARGVDSVHLIILMHGATADIEVTNYAVVKIVNISGGEVTTKQDIMTRIL